MESFMISKQQLPTDIRNNWLR